MSRLTGTDALGLFEAYQAVYNPQELTEEQVWEEVELWVESLLEEGYDLSDYTWEEMYESYLDEAAKRTPKKEKGSKDDTAYMAGRSDAGKRISGDENTGPRYYTLGRSRGATPDAPTRPGARPVNTPKLSSSEREYHQYDKSESKRRTAAGYNKVGGSKGLPESYDIILSYLLDEGYADTQESAQVIIENMSEAWVESIVEEVLDEAYVDYRKGKLPSGKTPQRALSDKYGILQARAAKESSNPGKKKRATGYANDDTLARLRKSGPIKREMDAHTSFGAQINKALTPGLGNRAGSSPRVSHGEPNTSRHQGARFRRGEGNTYTGAS